MQRCRLPWYPLKWWGIGFSSKPIPARVTFTWRSTQPAPMRIVGFMRHRVAFTRSDPPSETRLASHEQDTGSDRNVFLYALLPMEA